MNKVSNEIKISIFLISLIMQFSCKHKEQLQANKASIIKKDSLFLIKDTTVFSNSSEGENLLLFKNERTKDSVIKSTVYGEMGKVDFTFIFNKELLKANRLTSTYEEPIYMNSNPKIIRETKENLKTSILKKKELMNIFFEDVKFFRKKSNLTSSKIDSIIKKWEGIYYLSPYSTDSGEMGSYYIEIFRGSARFGFSGNDEFNVEVELNEEENKLYLFEKNKNNTQPKDTLAVLSKIDNNTFVKSKVIKIFRNDVKQNVYGYMFNWKKTLEEVPDTPE